MTERDIVILANSLRMSWHCLAGKDIHTGEWIRPINHSNPGRSDPSAFTDRDLTDLYGNASGPQLFDCVRIGFQKKCPTQCQPENIYIDKKPWKSLEPFQADKIPELIDESPFTWLGQNDLSTVNSDRIPESRVAKHPIDSSLIFLKLKPSKNEMSFIPDIDYHKRPRRRMKFIFNGRRYSFVVKDFHPSAVRTGLMPDWAKNSHPVPPPVSLLLPPCIPHLWWTMRGWFAHILSCPWASYAPEGHSATRFGK